MKEEWNVFYNQPFVLLRQGCGQVPFQKRFFMRTVCLSGFRLIVSILMLFIRAIVPSMMQNSSESIQET